MRLGVADRSGSITTLMRELKVDQNWIIPFNVIPLESILGRMGTKIGEGISSSLSAQLTNSTKCEKNTIIIKDRL